MRSYRGDTARPFQRRSVLLRNPHVTDAELVSLARSGDREAFGELVVRFGPAARRVARAVLRHPEDADDAAQEGFFSAWRHLEQYDAARPFGPWLLRIVVNAAQDLRRRRSVRETDQLPEGLPGGLASPETLVEHKDLQGRIDQALTGLAERQRVSPLGRLGDARAAVDSRDVRLDERRQAVRPGGRGDRHQRP